MKFWKNTYAFKKVNNFHNENKKKFYGFVKQFFFPVRYQWSGQWGDQARQKKSALPEEIVQIQYADFSALLMDLWILYKNVRFNIDNRICSNQAIGPSIVDPQVMARRAARLNSIIPKRRVKLNNRTGYTSRT